MTAALVQDFLVIDHVSKSFGALRAVDDVCLNVARGEVFSLLGPSGCGKTTLLRMLAGFERPESGRILLNGEDISALPPEKRPVNTVFQNYALFPHLSVWENIAFGLRIQGRDKHEIRKAVERMLALVRLEEQASKQPAQLSGGQKQRVAIARALINEPQVLLLDEPLAALDLKLRQHMLSELKALQREVGTTFIYVTHDQGEALSLSHRIAVMNLGRVEQVAVPEVLYEVPANAFVAGFIGEANFLSGSVREVLTEGRLKVEVADAVSLLVTASAEAKPGDVVRVMIRPENLVLSAERPSDDGVNSFAVTVDEVIYFGAHERVQLHCGALTLHVQQGRRAPTQALKPGLSGWVSFDLNAARVVGV
jgi:spermidine/putrescine transport system ATP-binding protein